MNRGCPDDPLRRARACIRADAGKIVRSQKELKHGSAPLTLRRWRWSSATWASLARWQALGGGGRLHVGALPRPEARDRLERPRHPAERIPEIGKVDQGEQQAGDPEHMHVCEEGQQGPGRRRSRTAACLTCARSARAGCAAAGTEARPPGRRRRGPLPSPPSGRRSQPGAVMNGGRWWGAAEWSDAVIPFLPLVEMNRIRRASCHKARRSGQGKPEPGRGGHQNGPSGSGSEALRLRRPAPGEGDHLRKGSVHRLYPVSG